jgi:hypothetical protein
VLCWEGFWGSINIQCWWKHCYQLSIQYLCLCAELCVAFSVIPQSGKDWTLRMTWKARSSYFSNYAPRMHKESTLRF